MERPAQAGAPAGRHRREACSFLSPVTREPQMNPGNMGEQFGKLTRATNAERWPGRLNFGFVSPSPSDSRSTLALPRTRKNSLILLQHPQFRLFADRDVQRQDGASNSTDDAENKDENEGDEDTVVRGGAIVGHGAAT